MFCLLSVSLACTFDESELPTGTGVDTTGGETTGGETTGGGGDTGGTSGGDDSGGVIDESPVPLARYRLAEQGQVNGGPLEIVDDAPNPVNLPLNVILESPSYGIDSSGNRYLRFQDSTGRRGEDTGGARLPIRNTKLEALNGAKQLTLVAKYTVDACVDLHQRIFGFSSGGDPDENGMLIMREQSGVEFLSVKWADKAYTTAYRWETACPFVGDEDEGFVVHWVIDTEQAIPENRVRGYINGEYGNTRIHIYFESTNEWPILGATVDLAGGQAARLPNIILGTEADGPRTANTHVWYAAVYDKALSAEEIAEDAGKLSDNDDGL